MFFAEFVSADFDSMYAKVKSHITKNELTIAQISKMSLLDVIKALKSSKYEYRELGSMWESLRGRIVKDMQEEQDAARIESFWNSVRSSVGTQYPKVTYEREDQAIKIYLDGK
jgi:hypothetical protein